MTSEQQTADRLESALSGGLAGGTGDPELDLLVSLVRAIPRVETLVPGPDPDFVTRLGVQLREEAHRRSAAPTPAPATPPGRARPAGPRRLHLPLRGLRWAGGLAAAALVLVATLGIASRQALPGDLMYPVKQLLDRIAVQVSDSGYDRGMTWLAQAQQHIDEGRALAATTPPRPDDEQAAWESARDAVLHARTELDADLARTHSDRSRLALPDFAATALPQLEAVRPDVAPSAVPAWQALRDLLEAYASPASTTPGSDSTTGAGTASGPKGLPTGATGRPTGSATGTATAPGSTTTSGPLVLPSVLPTTVLPSVTSTVGVPLPTSIGTTLLPSLTSATTLLPSLPSATSLLPSLGLTSATSLLPSVSLGLTSVSLAPPAP